MAKKKLTKKKKKQILIGVGSIAGLLVVLKILGDKYAQPETAKMSVY